MINEEAEGKRLAEAAARWELSVCFPCHQDSLAWFVHPCGLASCFGGSGRVGLDSVLQTWRKSLLGEHAAAQRKEMKKQIAEGGKKAKGEGEEVEEKVKDCGDRVKIATDPAASPYLHVEDL